MRVQALDAYLDRPWGWDPIMVPKYDKDGNQEGWELVARPENMEEERLGPKDRRLVEICKAELAEGRRVCVYPGFTSKRDVRGKMKKALDAAGIKAVILPDSVQPIKREDWIKKNLAKIEVLIVHPKRVMTGLDLIQFPTLVWYQVGYSTHVLRQASARSRRPTQKLPCKVIFLYYEGTIQEQALGLMGEKEAASQALEGVFDTRALKAMMNGGESDDILAALAKNLGPERQLSEVWKEVDAADNPFPTRPQEASTEESLRPVTMEKNTEDLELFSILSTKSEEAEEPSLFALVG